MDCPSAILPRSLHLPVAVTDGTVRENINEIGVRLWTDCCGQMGQKLRLSSTCDRPVSVVNS
jgi:hypothetical protein